MTAAFDQNVFIAVWITFTALALVAIAAVLVWAVRSRQFRDQDRARYLALRSGIPEDANSEHKPEPRA